MGISRQWWPVSWSHVERGMVYIRTLLNRRFYTGNGEIYSGILKQRTACGDGTTRCWSGNKGSKDFIL